MRGAGGNGGKRDINFFKILIENMVKFYIKFLQIYSLIHMRGSLIQLPEFSGVGRSVSVGKKKKKCKIENHGF